MHRWLYIIISACLFGTAVVTVSCGDLQDPASRSSGGVRVISRTTEAGFIDPTAIQKSQLSGNKQDEETVLSTSPSLLPAGATRMVTLAWDPSENASGYKVYIISLSTEVHQSIEVGPATELALPLQVGERYGFTVTAYNDSLESQSLPYVLFEVF